MQRILIIAFAPLYVVIGQNDGCRDLDSNCREWVVASARSCSATDYIVRSCRKSCGICGIPDKKYDVRRLPHNLSRSHFSSANGDPNTMARRFFPQFQNSHMAKKSISAFLMMHCKLKKR
ncbi:hypothetical protein KIN20_035807 [Parelaphostrongylus tenuis]|uniref:ShKT domain-containing protein n=1 Tax=Parelaphostrongylus tenuis TaxID=148309 RepID=A0AAD5WKS1_PARTN|nr:hypothetical protein KIN20_035807 [Parelaphostrongylus tenuis]